MANKLIILLILILIITTFAMQIPKKYEINLLVKNVSLTAPGSMEVSFYYTHVAHMDFGRYKEDASDLTRWHFAPPLTNKFPLENKVIEVYSTKNFEDFEFCTNFSTGSDGKIEINNFKDICGEDLLEFAGVKFYYVGDEDFQTLVHVYNFAGQQPFSANSFNALASAFNKVIESDIPCLMFIILTGIIFSAMFFQGDNPMQVFDITQPRLPNIRKGGMFGKGIKFKADLKKIMDVKKAAKASAKMGAIAGASYVVVKKNLKKTPGSSKNQLAVLNRARASKNLSAMQKLYLYQLIARGNIRKAINILDGRLTIPNTYGEINELIKGEKDKSPEYLKRVLEKKRLDEIGKKYVKIHKELGIEGTKFEKGRLVEVDAKGELEGVAVPGFVKKVRRIPIIGFAVATTHQAAKKVKDDFKKSQKDIGKLFTKKDFAEKTEELLLLRGPFDKSIKSATNIWDEIREEFVDEGLYFGMSASMLGFLARNKSKVKAASGENLEYVKGIVGYENLSTQEKNKLIKELEKQGYIQTDELTRSTLLSERRRYQLISRIFRNTRFKQTNLNNISGLMYNEYSTIDSDLNSFTGSSRSIRQVNYVKNLGSRYDSSKNLLNTIKGSNRDEFLREVYDESTGAEKFVGKIISYGKNKWSALTSVYGFTQAIGISSPEFPSYMEYESRIGEQAKKIMEKDKLSYNEAHKKAEEEQRKEFKKIAKTKVVMGGVVQSISDLDYAKQIRFGRPDVQRIDRIEDNIRKNYYNQPLDEGINSFLNRINNKADEFKTKDKEGRTFEEAYKQAVNDTDAFILSMSPEFGQKEEDSIREKYIDGLDKYSAKVSLSSDYLLALERTEGRAGEAQADIIEQHKSNLDKHAIDLTNNPYLVQVNGLVIKEEGTQLRVFAPYSVGEENKVEIDEGPERRIDEGIIKKKQIKESLDVDSDEELEERDKQRQDIANEFVSKRASYETPRIDVLKNPDSLFNGELKIINPETDKEEKFDKTKEYDFSKFEHKGEDLSFVGTVLGEEAFNNMTELEKIRFLMQKGVIYVSKVHLRRKKK